LPKNPKIGEKVCVPHFVEIAESYQNQNQILPHWFKAENTDVTCIICFS